MEQPPEGTPERLSEYLTRYFNSLILSVNYLKDTIRLWNKNGFTGAFIGNLTGNVTGNSFTFPATQVPSSNANTLDDYEEGTWNPVVTSSVGTITAYTASGNYIKIGKLVYYTVDIAIATNGTGSTVGFSTLPPFTPARNASGVGRNVISGGMLYGQITASGSQLLILKYNDTYPFVSGTVVFISGTYEATA
jgi:hypothetical protein